jgi:excisionase family DNA binding protein
MEKITFTQLTEEDLREMIRQELTDFFKDKICSKAESQKDGEYLNVTQAAEFLGLTKQTIYFYIKTAILPSYKFGKRVFFKKSEILEYIGKLRRKSKDEINEIADEYIKAKRYGK